MIKKIGCFFVFINLFFFSSCQTLENQGKDLYKKELYDQALIVFEAAASKDPSNTELKAWLQKTKTKIIDKGLLEVRFLRMGNNSKAATEKLEKVLRQQEKWHTKYTSALASSQEKEVKEANLYLENLIKQAKSHKTPSSIKLIAHKFDRTIQAGRAKDFLQNIQAQLRKTAEKKYLALASELTRTSFFSQDILDSYAALWQIDSKKRVKLGQDSSRFSSIRIIDKIDHNHMSKLNFSMLGEKLREDFHHSLLYYPGSKKTLVLKLTGQTNYSKTNYLSTETARYNEPYTDYVLKRVVNPNLSVRFKRIEWRYHNDGYAHCYVNGRNVKKAECSALPRPEKGRAPISYYLAPVTRYRNKNFHYQVLVHNEKYLIKIKGLFKNLGQKPSIDLLKEDQNQTKSHNLTVSEAGVYPRYPSFFNMEKKENNAINLFTKKFKEEMNSEWSKRYCHNQGSSYSEKTEFTHRCSLVNPEHQKVKQWYKKNFGINYRDFQKLTS